MKKIVLILSALTVLAACNGTASPEASPEAAPVTDTTSVSDSCCAEVDSNYKETPFEAKK